MQTLFGLFHSSLRNCTSINTIESATSSTIDPSFVVFLAGRVVAGSATHSAASVAGTLVYIAATLCAAVLASIDATKRCAFSVSDFGSANVRSALLGGAFVGCIIRHCKRGCAHWYDTVQCNV